MEFPLLLGSTNKKLFFLSEYPFTRKENVWFHEEKSPNSFPVKYKRMINDSKILK